MMLTKIQINRIRKAASKGTAVDFKISKIQIPKAIQKGDSLFSALMPVLGKVLPYASKIVGPLVTGALSGLNNLGVNKLFGSGNQQGDRTRCSVSANAIYWPIYSSTATKNREG